MKISWLIALILAALFFTVLAVAALGQNGTPPPPYAGMKNPFPWDDVTAREAGKKIFQQQCSGCHGATGGGLAAFDFSRPTFSHELEMRPDYFFWILSEGRISQGMPGYKASLTAEQIWQTLTYMETLSSAPPPASPQPVPPPEVQGASLSIVSPGEASIGHPVSFTAILKDSQDKPVAGATVKYFLKEDFFATGLMEIGEATTDSQGMAYFIYTPQRTGGTTLTAKYASTISEASLTINDTGEVFYQSEAGLPFLAGGPEVFIGPPSSHEVDEMGNAPNFALRLPGGLISWLWVVIGVMLLVWVTYFIVMYQVLHIPAAGAGRGVSSRLVPVTALIIILGLGLLMLFMVITGPYSHFHLMP